MRKLIRMSRQVATVVVVSALAFAASVAHATDALPSWNDGTSKRAIVSFVETVIEEGGSGFVPPAERIAVFDNDGTLWAEQPLYFQLAFALDRVKELAPKHPEWNDTEPFKSALAGDMKGVAATGKHGLLELVAASHAGNTTEEFQAIVRQWITTARHPTLKRPYTSLVYQPMLEVLAYLRVHGFKTFLVSGGGIEFLRVMAEELYGVPPEQVVGSSIVVKYDSDPKNPTLQRLPEINFIDDKAGKPVGIYYHIGRRPIAAFGNSDGDFEMLEWTTTGPGARLGMLVRHDDAKREFAYDRASHIGKLARGLDEAPKRGWGIISMSTDWSRVFPDVE